MSDRTIYDRTFFVRFDVATAEDMLRRIPGAGAILDAAASTPSQRGLGGGADFLLNGRRFPGKSNEITKLLRRVPASNVERVELIRDPGAAVTVQSDGPIVNLVLREGADLEGAGSWEFSVRGNDHGSRELDGLLSYTGYWGATTYTVGVERNVWSPASMPALRWTHRKRNEIYQTPGGELLEARAQVWDRDYSKWTYTGRISSELDADARVQLNALYETRDVSERDVTSLARYDPLGVEVLRATETHVREIGRVEVLEIGGEYGTRLGPGQLTSIFIIWREDNPTDDVRRRREPNRDLEISRSESELQRSEDIIRSSYALGLARGQALEMGVEVARNSLRQDLAADFDLNGDGQLDGAAAPFGAAEVKELRAELYASHRWRPLPAISLEATLAYERSRITTNTPLNPGRDLGVLKPRLDFRLRPSPGNELRLLVERTASQLQFGNFLPSYNVVDDRIEAGNPTLKPETAWIYEARLEHRLEKDGGVMEARVFHHAVRDTIDKAPLIQGGALVGAQANIGSAKLSGAEAKASVRLAPLGAPDALLTIRYLRQWSEVKDPFTGFRRPLRSDGGYALDVGFRHDWNRAGLSYGFNYVDVGEATVVSDLRVREYHSIDPTLEAFVERKLSHGMTLRLDLQNLTGSRERKRRIIYLRDQRDGRVRREEVWRERRDLRFGLKLRGAI